MVRKDVFSSFALNEVLLKLRDGDWEKSQKENEVWVKIGLFL